MRPTDYQLKTQAESYSKKRFKGGLKTVNQDEMNLLKQWLSFYSSSERYNIFLDIGTGTGRLLKVILKSKPKIIIALDASQAMLDYLKKLYSKKVQDGTIKLIKADSDRTSLNPNNVDIITGFHLMKHLKNIEPTIKESYRILKPNGYMIFDILNRNSLVRLNLETCFALNENQIRNLLQKNGFKIVETRYMNTFGETIYNIMPDKIRAIFQIIDQLISNSILKSGTKIFILAQKI